MLNKLKIPDKILLGFSIPVFLMLIMACVVCVNVTEMVDTANWVKHTQEVIADARKLEKLIVDMETGERGFLITGKDEFLEPFYEAQRIWDEKTKKVINLVADNQEQVSRIAEVDALAKQWLIIAAQPEIAARIESNKTGASMDNVITLVSTRTGKKVIDMLRKELDKFIKVETNLLKTRELKSENAASNTITTTITGTILAILIALFSSVRISNTIADRLKVLIKKTIEISSGNLTGMTKDKNNDEIGTLSAAFSSMMLNLQKSREEIVRSKIYANNIIQSMMDMLIVIDLDGRIRTVNRSTLDVLGYAEKDLTGKDFSIILDEKDFLQNLIQQGAIGYKEKTLSAKDAGKIPVILSGSVMRGNNEEVEAVVCVAKDITKQNQANNLLQERTDHLRLAIKAASMGEFEWNITEDILTWSEETLQMFGTTADEFGGNLQAYLAFIPLESRKEVEKKINEYMKEKHISDDLIFDHEIIRGDGKSAWIEVRSRLFRDDKSRPLRFSGIGIEITKRKQSEDALRQAQKMESVGTLAGGIAHDFNNILGGIIGYTELSKDDTPDDSPVQAYLDEILRSTKRSSELVRQILTFSRKSSEELKLIKISPIIKESIRLLRATLPATTEIRQNISDSVGVIKANQTQIHQIMMNLGTNAYHAVGEHGLIDVMLASVTITEADINEKINLNPGSYVKLTVQDNGNGIDPSNIDRIFEPYFTTKEVNKGTGMGLSVTHGIVSSHGGKITVESRLGKGTVFDIYLPQVTAAHADMAGSSAEIIFGTGHILFVDDEKTLTDIAQRMLSSLGYTVSIANTAIKALKVFKENTAAFDLIITDQTMPKMTGYALAREILEIRPDIPVILATGYSQKISEEEAKKIGIKAYVDKPLTKAMISKAIHNVLNNSRSN